MKLGLISDTHGFLDPSLTRIFKGVDHILHAGDIGPDFIIAQLEAIAPVTAVLGNNDESPCFPLTQIKLLGDVKFLVRHIVSPREPVSELKARIQKEKPDVVMFGHTHKPFDQVIGGVRFINPGYAGQPRFAMDRSVALLEISGKKLELRFVKLTDSL